MDHKTFEHVVFQGADLLWIFWKQNMSYIYIQNRIDLIGIGKLNMYWSAWGSA